MPWSNGAPRHVTPYRPMSGSVARASVWVRGGRYREGAGAQATGNGEGAVLEREHALVLFVGHELRGGVGEDADDVHAVALPVSQHALLLVDLQQGLAHPVVPQGRTYVACSAAVHTRGASGGVRVRARGPRTRCTWWRRCPPGRGPAPGRAA
eukprot:scaffold753_cov320-Prasinococcus_capsulatus_cf.AAC.6